MAVGEEKIEGFLDKKVVGSLFSLDKSKEHEVEAHKSIDIEGGIILPKTLLQDSNMPSPLLAIEEEKIEGVLEKEPIGNADLLGELKEHEAEAYKPINIKGGGVVSKIVPCDSKLSLPLLAVREEKIEGFLDKELVGSSLSLDE